MFSPALQRRAALLAGAVFAFAFVGAAQADGEAGLVIQDGDAVKTYCIAFAGDGVTGDQLLKAAGQEFSAFGSGSGAALCSINDSGCPNGGSYSSCFCQCQGGDCTYWAFFTRSFGKRWEYSQLAFNLLKARDGDVHGWKWGKGGANSAPAPQDITFDQICGHAPRGGAVQQPTAAATAAPQATVVASATIPLTAAASASVAPPSSTSGTPSMTAPLVTIGNETAISREPAPPVKGNSGGRQLVLFALVAGLLVVAIAGASFWRTRRG